MSEKRQLELYLLRLVPHALRDDFMTVGVVVIESDGAFADVRFTRDWKRVECFAPEIELEHLERLESAVRTGLKEIRGRADLLKLLEERFGPEFDVGPVKGIEAMDPAAEMAVLTRENDPFQIDFGFRVGNSLKMFHALALNLSREPAVTLAYRYARIQEGMRKRGEAALLTAVISEDAGRREEIASGIGMLKANEIRVRDVGEMAEIADEVRR